MRLLPLPPNIREEIGYSHMLSSGEFASQACIDPGLSDRWLDCCFPVFFSRLFRSIAAITQRYLQELLGHGFSVRDVGADRRARHESVGCLARALPIPAYELEPPLDHRGRVQA